MIQTQIIKKSNAKENTQSSYNYVTYQKNCEKTKIVFFFGMLLMALLVKSGSVLLRYLKKKEGSRMSSELPGMKGKNRSLQVAKEPPANYQPFTG